MMLTVVRCAVVMGLVASCISPVMRFGDGKTAKEAQRETMSDLGPARLVTGAKWPGEIATRKVRVWADNQYRAQNVRWQQSFEGPLEFANLVLTPLFGLHLVPEYHAWERHVPGSTLAADLEALAERDPGHDVLIVVGLTSSLPLVSATFEDLGYATIGGRHLMLRGYADLEERKLYADAFRDLLPEERELSLEARRHHKTAVMLLHEIGHNLGADHVADHDTIMHAMYSHRASAFSEQSRQIILRTIDQRLGRASSTGDSGDATAAIDPKPKRRDPGVPLVFHVTQSGDVLAGEKVLGDMDLDNLLVDAFERDPETEIIIKRQRKAPTGALERIVGRATRIGLKRVSLSTY